MGWFSRARTQYEALVARYGKVAIITYFSIFFSVLFGFWLAILSGADLAGGLASLGLDTRSATSRSGTFVVAYGFTKLTQPVRIAATVVLTPLIARFVGRAPAPHLPAEPPAEG
ncbi:FAM210 family protein [Myxococcota bacterium]|nr:FAM210 family protein [Myxococcota bacterium]